jgi:hypothetical protein
MGAWKKLLGAALLCALICALPARALASENQESVMMDDNQLIYASPTHVAKALQQMAALGVDRIKVSMVWSLVAPDAQSTQRPHFDATDPAAYPDGAWNRYDMVVRLASELGIGVYFQVTAPAPSWAVSTRKPTQGYPWSQNPSASQFGQFVQAIGRRYSGTYVASVPKGTPPPSLLGIPLNLPGLVAQPSPPASPSPIPRVDWWGLWNEPNEGAWLNPQTRTVHKRPEPVAPALDRGLTNAGWYGLLVSGHGNDTILIGETASGGTTLPLPFLRALYCVTPLYRPMTGSQAAANSCPTAQSRTTFVATNPGLFFSTGFAHHPYSFDIPPNHRMSNPGAITLANLGTLEHGLNRIFAAYGRAPPGGVPLYLTEWGYKTNPPNPFVKTSLVQQATWLNQGEYIAWSYPYVRALAQFLLVDDRPKAGEAVGSRSYWGTFQTGLITTAGARKPGYYAYRIPIWLPVARHGRYVTVWAHLRPANHKALQYAVLWYRRGRGSWTQLREIQTADSEGFLIAHVAIPGPGQLQLSWLSPSTGAIYYSRIVSVS